MLKIFSFEHYCVITILHTLKGLTHNAVSRLRHTWERIPEKYNKLLSDLQVFFNIKKKLYLNVFFILIKNVIDLGYNGSIAELQPISKPY